MLSQTFIQIKLFLTSLGPRLKQGQGLIEYALIILLVIIVVIGTLIIFGDQVAEAYQSITNAIHLDE